MVGAAPPAERPRRSSATRPALGRAPFLAAGFVALSIGLWAGLARLGLAVAAPAPVAATHGPLMVVGFLGAVISAERAAALGRAWGWAAPALCAAGALLTALHAPVGPLVGAGGMVALAATFVALARREPELHMAVMLGGAAAGAVASVAWGLGAPIPAVLPGWILFVVWTIAGERLELTRLVKLPDRARVELLGWTGAAAAAALVVAFTGGSPTADAATRAFGAAIVGVAAWLGRHDVARRTIRTAGLPRFSGVCLLIGYLWLGVAGVAFAAFGPQSAGLRYDVQVHALFLGFVFSMILGHAPIIFPAVLKLPVPFRRVAWGPLALLHAFLVVRVVGDLAVRADVRDVGGVGGVVAIAAFVATTVGGVVAAGVRRRKGALARSPRLEG